MPRKKLVAVLGITLLAGQAGLGSEGVGLVIEAFGLVGWGWGSMALACLVRGVEGTYGRRLGRSRRTRSGESW